MKKHLTTLVFITAFGGFLAVQATATHNVAPGNEMTAYTPAAAVQDTTPMDTSKHGKKHKAWKKKGMMDSTARKDTSGIK